AKAITTTGNTDGKPILPRLARSTLSPKFRPFIKPNSHLELILKRKYIGRAFNGMTRFPLILVKYPDILLRTIEVQAAYWLAIIVIQQHAKVAQGVPVNNPVHINAIRKNCTNNIKALKLF